MGARVATWWMTPLGGGRSLARHSFSALGCGTVGLCVQATLRLVGDLLALNRVFHEQPGPLVARTESLVPAVHRETLGGIMASRWAGRVILFGGVSIAAACSADPIQPLPNSAELRLLHATPGLGAVTVQMDNATVIQNVTYGNSSQVVLVPSGLHRFVVRAGSQTIGELDQALTTQHINTVVVSAGAAQFASVVTPDTGSVATNRANLRIVNVVGSNTTAPTLLDVLVKAPDVQNPDSVMKFGIDTKVASYGTLMYFNPGHFDFKFVPRGETTVLTQLGFEVALGETKAVVLERAANGTYSARVVMER